MPVISKKWDIKSLIEHYAKVTVVYSSEVRIPGGGTTKEYHSNCPWCSGSHDSFIMQPELGRYSHAARSGCGRIGDAIDFLMEYEGMDQDEAIEELELKGVSFYRPRPKPVRKKLDPPCEKWQETANIFIERAVRYLWGSSPKAQEALAYLRGRGLDDVTIRREKYGYCPLQSDGQWYGADPLHGGLEHWGLKPEDVKPEIAERGTIRIPPGVIIPWYQGDTLWKVAVRRLDEPDPDRRYRPVAGSVDALYNIDSIQPGRPAMIVESEFCAASVEQAAGDLVAVVATGSVPKGRNPHFAPKLLQASYLIQSFDNDEPDAQGKRAGDAGAVWWLCHYDSCFRHKPMGGKDPNDMLRYHGKVFVQDWVQAALDQWEGYRQAGMIPQTLARVS